MDYKMLIEHLKCWKEEFIASLCEDYIIDCGRFCDGGTDDCIVEKAITAIETLLVERDAAVEMMRGKCYFCKHKEDCGESAQYVAECSNGSDWEWCGTQGRTK